MLTLPPALAHLATYRQFFLYRVTQVPGEPKPRKVPVHPVTLQPVDAHAPSMWVDADTACARATGLGAPYLVGFSFQPGNGLFFIDIDGALQADGAWSPLAQQLCARFPGAAVEVSQSGKGLHIIARGSAPPHACKNVPLGIELYTEYRGAALTGTHAAGDASTDHTAALAKLVAEYFPPREGDGLPDGAWTAEPRADWRGPEDDAELLRRARKSSSVAAQFGAKRATFEDLWTRNADVLCAVWPDPLKGYDASSADAALAAHLAFWTGCDCERMDRLMRQSALVREKWERHDYLPRTILGAAARQRDVLQDKAPEAVAGAPVSIAAPESRLKTVSVADVLTNPSPPPGFIWGSLVVYETVTMLSAHGGTGKSTIALMLAVCAATGRDLFGLQVDKCVAVFVSLEDGLAVVRHRLSVICRAWSLDPRELEGRLHVVDGTDHPELYSAEGRGSGETTLTFAEMRSLVRSVGAGLVVVDNASDAFGADEIQRRPVRAFIRSLVDIAKESKAAVLLLAHVDKATSKARKSESGEGYSGSTAWHNSARSRLFLTRADDGTLTLEHQKSNFGKLQDPLTLRWADGELPEVDHQGIFLAPGARLQGHGSDEKAAALLRVLAEYESRHQYCSPVATARNNVFSMLKSEPAFQTLKLGADKCRLIVNQCQRMGWIEVVEYRTHDRKTRERWTLTGDGRAFAGLVAPCAPCAPSSEQSAESAKGAPSAPSCAGGVGEKRAHRTTRKEVHVGEVQP
ncbi:MAG: AAA family ATPase [Hydrogenophaga sp.]|uniref:AAA family ATPase n=1 Tax=Hydrogenophaga sp. TaxID=1904254 RepID=UPI002631ED45|nr:AAA family ATPase [Hydrogenophaga sp.]MCW5669399.1 AAA family ATPase [Hydrogenophaga sp.]